MGGRGGHSHRMTSGRGASAIDRLTSITQLNSWLRNQDWFRPGSYISLNGVDLEAARGIAKAYQQVFERYPQLKGIFSGVKSFDLGSGTYADCNLATGQIRVSNTMYRRLQELERSYARDIRANWHPAGTDWAAILTHEIGHAIDGYITQHSEGGFFSMTGIEIQASCRRRSPTSCMWVRPQRRSPVSFPATGLSIRWSGLQSPLQRECVLRTQDPWHGNSCWSWIRF